MGLKSHYELMAVMVFGHPKKKEKDFIFSRKPLEALILKKLV